MDVDLKEKLKTVFDVCDTQQEGFITVAHFKNLAKEHFGADRDEDVIGIVQILDPDGKGQINFNDFCHGVQQILELQNLSPIGPVKDTNKNVFEFFPSFGTSNGFHEGDLLGDISPIEGKELEASEASAYTFNEYDTNTDEDGGGLLIDLSTPEPVRRTNPQLIHSQLDCTDEENFEDFGEADDLESDTSHSDHSSHKSCETCHKIRSKRGVNYREKHHRRSSGASRRLNSSFLSNNILQSKSRSPAPDDVLDDIDGNFDHLNNKIQFLEQKIHQLSEEKHNSDTIKTKFKDENSVLIESIMERVHTLEEQLRDVEVKSDERVLEEQKKYKELMSRKDREKSEQVEYITNRLQKLESENEKNPKLRAEVDRLRSEKLQLQDQLSELQLDYNTLLGEHEEHQKKSDRERETTGQLLDELQKELRELRQYKIDTENSVRPRGESQNELPGRYHSLQTEVTRLKEALTIEWRTLAKENKSLLDVNEELNAQLLNQCLNEGRAMSGEVQNSLAHELDHLTKEELMKKLNEQTDISIRLKAYMDKILLLIMEKNPSLLEKC